jgi:hypothetical protein
MHFDPSRLYLFPHGQFRPLGRPICFLGKEWKMRFKSLGAMIALLAGLLSPSAFAAVISLVTPVGADTGQPVSAKATFTTSAGQIIVLLENLQADPRSAVQCLSGLTFTVSTGQNSGTLASSSGTERTIAGDGSYSDGGSAPIGWALSTSGSSLKLDLLSTGISPTHTIIGPPNGSNAYGNANNSITGGTHSPFIAQSGTFTINVPGVTATSTITAATFQFNTSPGSTIVGIPEPASALLVGLLGAGASARRQRRSG